MDFHVRYWDDLVYKIRTGCWSSEYLIEASADGVHAKYNKCFSLLNKSKLL